MDESPDQKPPAGWILHPLVWSAGLAGSLVSLSHTPNLTLRQRAVTVVTGLLASGFITPAVADWLHLNVNFVALVGFVVGVSGMSLTAVIVTAADAIKKNPAVAVGWVAALLGRKLPQLPTVPPESPAVPAPTPVIHPPAGPPPAPKLASVTDVTTDAGGPPAAGK